MKKVLTLAVLGLVLVFGVAGSAQVKVEKVSTYDCNEVIEFQPLKLCQQ